MQFPPPPDFPFRDCNFILLHTLRTFKFYFSLCFKWLTPNLLVISRGHRCAKKNCFLYAFFVNKFASSEQKLSYFSQSFRLYLDIISTYSLSSQVASLVPNYRCSHIVCSNVLHFKLLDCKFSSVHNSLMHSKTSSILLVILVNIKTKTLSKFVRNKSCLCHRNCF